MQNPQTFYLHSHRQYQKHSCTPSPSNRQAPSSNPRPHHPTDVNAPLIDKPATQLFVAHPTTNPTQQHTHPPTMAFRKRNTVLPSSSPSSPSSPSTPSTSSPSPSSPPPTLTPTPPPPGTRPSPISGRPTTSTGAASLDAILAGHAGLPLGNSVLIGETGTTDYAGALLRFYGAEGVVQGQRVHVVGVGEGWGRELPGVAEGRDAERERKREEGRERMKIAWRYEGLGAYGGRDRERGACVCDCVCDCVGGLVCGVVLRCFNAMLCCAMRCHAMRLLHL